MLSCMRCLSLLILQLQVTLLANAASNNFRVFLDQLALRL